MKYSLNILERLALLNMLPLEGNVATLKLMRELQNELSFSEEEMKRFKMTRQKKKDGEEFMTWDSDFNKETKDIEIGEVLKDVIVEQLRELEARKKLRMELLRLWDKFM